MKTYLYILTAILVSVGTAQAQSTVESLLRLYHNDDNAVAWNLTGDLLNIFASATDSLGVESTVDDVSVVMFEKGADVSDKHRAQLKELLADNHYESLINARTDGRVVKIYALDSGDYIERLYGRVDTGDYILYATLSGRILYSDITKIDVEQFTKLNLGG